MRTAAVFVSSNGLPDSFLQELYRGHERLAHFIALMTRKGALNQGRKQNSAG